MDRSRSEKQRLIQQIETTNCCLAMVLCFVFFICFINLFVMVDDFVRSIVVFVVIIVLVLILNVQHTKND